jgi:hypothetical protein
MLTAEVFNWTGHVLMTPRTRISAALSRKEASFTGVYLLLGEQEGEPTVYMGEGEDIGERIRNHDTKKDWWTTAVLVTSTANNLNKAHVKYLESRLVEEARATRRFKLDNGNTPPRPGLSEAAQSNMEAFLDYLFMVLPALRVDTFITNTRPSLQPSLSGAVASTPRFKLIAKKNKIDATALLKDGDFIVEAGSTARQKWIGAGHTTGYALLYEELRKTGILDDLGDHCVFTQNYAFTSPSAAAAVVLGRSANGTTEWRVDGEAIDYKGWEERQIKQELEKTS